MRKLRRHLITLNSLTTDDLHEILQKSLSLATGTFSYSPLLDGMIIGLYFRKTSTRTRTAFSSAALRLGAKIISFGPNDLQENTGESLEDTTKVLSGMLDCLVGRTAGSQHEMEVMASQAKMSVINAMTMEEHPTQALADLTTMLQIFGSVSNLRILYVGEGNNTASALCRSIPRFANTELFFYSPPGYKLPTEVINEGKNYGKLCNSQVSEISDLRSLPTEIDIVYTTRWETTGT
ncbi:MAG: ornithine carbamoyltransferase, partial [Marivirga sp.]|nr:ornithine carbamoyltransferase [Marivirga sp.]